MILLEKSIPDWEIGTFEKSASEVAVGADVVSEVFSQEKIKSNLGKVEETVSSGKRKSSEVDDSDGKDQGAFKPTKKKARK